MAAEGGSDTFPSVSSVVDPAGYEDFDASIRELHSRRMQWVKSVDSLLGGESRGSGSVAARAGQARQPTPGRAEDKSVKDPQSFSAGRSSSQASGTPPVAVGFMAVANTKINRIPRGEVENRGIVANAAGGQLDRSKLPLPRTPARARAGRPSRKPILMSRSLSRLNVRLRAAKAIKAWWKGRHGRRLVNKWYRTSQALVFQTRKQRTRGGPERGAAPGGPREAWGPVRAPDAAGIANQVGYRGTVIPDSWMRERAALQDVSQPGVAVAQALAKGFVARAIYRSRHARVLRAQMADVREAIRGLAREEPNSYRDMFKAQLDNQMARIRTKFAELFFDRAKRQQLRVLCPRQQAPLRPATAPLQGPGKSRLATVREGLDRRPLRAPARLPDLPTDRTVEFVPGPVGLVLQSSSARVKHVHPGKQAEMRGVRPGWIVTEVNGLRVSDPTKVMLSLSAAKRSGGAFTVGFCAPEAASARPTRSAWPAPKMSRVTGPRAAARQPQLAARSPAASSASPTTSSPSPAANMTAPGSSSTAPAPAMSPKVSLTSAASPSPHSSPAETRLERPPDTKDVENAIGGSASDLGLHPSTLILLKKLGDSLGGSFVADSIDVVSSAGPAPGAARRKMGGKKPKISRKLKWKAKSRTVSKLEPKYMKKPREKRKKKAPRTKPRPKPMDLSKVKSKVNDRWTASPGEDIEEGADEQEVQTPRGRADPAETSVRSSISKGISEELTGDKSKFFLSVSAYRKAMRGAGIVRETESPEPTPAGGSERASLQATIPRRNLRYSRITGSERERARRPNSETTSDADILSLRARKQGKRLDEMHGILADIEQTVELLIGDGRKMHIFDPPSRKTRIPHVTDATALMRMAQKDDFQNELQSLWH